MAQSAVAHQGSMGYSLPTYNSLVEGAVAAATPSFFGSGIAKSTINALVVPLLCDIQQTKTCSQNPHVRGRSDFTVGLQPDQTAMQSSFKPYSEPKTQTRDRAQGIRLQGVENGNPQAAIPPRYGPAHRTDKQALARYAALASDPNYLFVLWKGGDHLRPEYVTMARRQRSGISFLDLPGEIRNHIYEYAYDFKKLHIPNYPVSAITNGPPVFNVQGASGVLCRSATDSCFSLLSLCRQTAFEAGTLFNFLATAYIPIHSTWDIFKCYKRLARYSTETLHPVEHTMLAALLHVKDLHLHLHLEASRDHSSDGPIMHLLRVFQHLKGAKYADRWGGQRRKITVHLDHYFADDRRLEVRLQQGSIHNIVTQMGKFEKADFTIAYYIHTGHDTAQVPTAKWRNERVKEFEDLSNRILNYSHIKCIRPEIRGVGRWTELSWPDSFLKAVTTKVSKQSTVWPAYPDSLHGPDRKERRAEFARPISKTF